MIDYNRVFKHTLETTREFLKVHQRQQKGLFEVVERLMENATSEEDRARLGAKLEGIKDCMDLFQIFLDAGEEAMEKKLHQAGLGEEPTPDQIN